MNNFKDIRDNLEKNIDIGKNYKPRKIKFSGVIKKTINDIRKNLKSTLDISTFKYVRVFKNNTKNYDSLLSDKRLKDINIVETKGFFQRLTRKNIFTRRKLLSKNFLRRSTYFLIAFILVFVISSWFAKVFIDSGYKRLLSLTQSSGDLMEIRKTLKKARFDFVMSSFLFKPLLLIPNDNIKNGNYIIKGGKDLVVLGDELLSYYNYILFLIEREGIDSFSITDTLKSSKLKLYDFSTLLSKVIYSYDKIGDLGDMELQRKFIKGKEFLQYTYNQLTLLNRNFDTFLNILGNNEERKYLILLQNNDEIRPTGGFIGSIGIMKVFNGKIVDLDFQDTYAYEWEINKEYTEKIEAPRGIDKITETLGFRDSNYKISFSESTKQIKFFTDKIDNELDGIIYLNQSIVLDLLSITGDLEVNFDENINNSIEKIGESNFSEVISTLVEAKAFKVGTLGTPKRILFDFGEVLFGELKKQKKYPDYLKVFLDNIASRDIVINLFAPEENSLIWKLGLGGEVDYSNTLDYAYPVFTSIGGGKTDRYYKRDYRKLVNMNLDCSIDTRLEITGFHLFTQEKEDYILGLMDRYNITDKNILFIQGKTDNKAYVRVLLPKEAKIKESSYINITELEKHQLVEFYTRTRRLEKVIHTIEYTIPNTTCEDYSFALYKQPGIRSFDIEMEENGKLSKKYGTSEDYYYNFNNIK